MAMSPTAEIEIVSGGLAAAAGMDATRQATASAASLARRKYRKSSIESLAMRSLPLVECCTPIAGRSLTDDDAVELERLFRAIADRHRLKILNMLVRARPEAVCVCEFQPELGLSQPTVSYHLKQLLETGLLEREKRGTFAYYRLAPRVLERLRSLLAEPASAR
jgi:ArsR family transcriptional regulator